jgi:molecular chaperone GrpE
METQENTQEKQEVAAEQENNKDSELSAEEALKAELEEQKKKYLYLYAEFETYKGRVIKERSELVKFGSENIIREMLVVVDNLERALEHAQGNQSDATLDHYKSLVTGIEMVRNEFRNTLSKFGVKPIEAMGQKFDPEKHEAMGSEKSSSAEEGSVIKEFQKGYTLHGRLLRPARVVVAAKG